MNKNIKFMDMPKSWPDNVQFFAYFYAFILLIFALTQLFTFDGFLKLIESFGVTGGAVTAYLIGSSIVISEVFALPFLLEMKLRPLIRKVSLVLGLLVPILWLILSIWVVLFADNVENIGFLGTKFSISPGIFSIAASLFIGLLAAFVCADRLPFIARKK
jgi:hypothetical protein